MARASAAFAALVEGDAGGHAMNDVAAGAALAPSREAAEQAEGRVGSGRREETGAERR